MPDIPHKHAFITGGARRVGRAIALSLAQAGYRITLHYHSSEDDAHAVHEQISRMGGACHLLQADLCDAHTLPALLHDACKAQGAVNLLVHNASVFERDDLMTITPDSLARHVALHMTAPIMLSQGFMQQLPQDAHGHIICLLDGMVNWSMSPEFLSYSLSKMGLENFIHLQAPALAPRARINGIALGATMPGVMDGEDIFERLRERAPLKRNSSPEEVCAALHALEALPSATAQMINLSGGMQLSGR